LEEIDVEEYKAVIPVAICSQCLTCTVCGAELAIHDEPATMKCHYCGSEEKTYTYCINKHYVCNTCWRKHSRCIETCNIAVEVDFDG
jgi:primosomal protein N'